MPDFVMPQLCRVVERPPSGAGWAHEIKFDGYRMQLRVAGGQATLTNPQGARLDRQVPGDRRGRGEAARRADRRRDRRARRQRHPGFRGAAGGAVGRQDRRSRLLRLRSAVRRWRGSARRNACGAQGAARKAAARQARRHRDCAMSSISRPTATPCSHSARDAGLEGIVSKRLDRALCVGPRRRLDQVQMPAGPRGGHRRLGHDEGPLSLVAGRGQPRRPPCLYRPRRHRVRRGQGQGADAAASRPPPPTRARSAAPMRRAASRGSIGLSLSWSPRSSSPAGPPTAMSARPRSRGCARTSPPRRSRQKP